MLIWLFEERGSFLFVPTYVMPWVEEHFALQHARIVWLSQQIQAIKNTTVVPINQYIQVLWNKLRPALLIVQAASDKNKSFCLQNKGITSAHKQELANNSKCRKKAPRIYHFTVIKMLTDLENEDLWKYLKTLSCIGYIFFAIWIEFHASLQFLISFIPPVDT